jgi:hypothetical protein
MVPMHANGLLDLTGQKFGALLAIERIGFNNFHKAVWHARCDCGATIDVVASNLRSGNSKSCGCLKSADARGRAIARNQRMIGKQHPRFKHGETRSPEWRSWISMRTRCECPSATHFRLYGGRGIKVCRRWLQFQNFLADMGRKPTPRHSIDRINGDGNYTPANCRWATPTEQNRNRRRRKIRGCGCG